MAQDSNYPRVLIVAMTKVKAHDAVNLLFRTQFGDWPEDRLAQIYSGEAPGSGEFCGACYQLRPVDRTFGKLFMKLRGGVGQMVATGSVGEGNATAPGSPPARWLKKAKLRMGRVLIKTGLWEILFRVRLSEEMNKFIRDFKPDILYCSGYTLAFSELPLLIQKEFGVPICFQTLEDWPAYAYPHSPVGAVLRKAARNLIRHANLRLAFGSKMTNVYGRRYGGSFHTTYQLDDLRRFERARPRENCQGKQIVFTGSLQLRRYEALEDMIAAVRTVENSETPIQVLVYASRIPADLPESVRSAPEVTFLPIPSHDDLPGVLNSGDVLFLPESFSESEARLGLAVSTKCHLYMMSDTPTLAYGPAYAGSMGYAQQDGWALPLTERNVEKLAECVRRLLDDDALKGRLQRKGVECFNKNHEERVGKERFRRLMGETAEAFPD